MPSFSILIPSYRYGHFLSECVHSVLAQVDVELRVLILDDASPDETPRIAQALAAADARVTYQRAPANQGHIATFNAALTWADGDYTLLLSADDMLTPGALARAARLLEAHPEVGLCYGPVIPFTSGEPLPAPRLPAGEPRWAITSGRDWLAAGCRRAHVPVLSPGVIMRTSVWREVGPFSPALPHSADLHLWLRFGLRAAAGCLVDADQAYYRLHPHNLHKTLAPTRLLDLRYRWEAFEALFDQHHAELERPARLKRMAARRLAREALLEAARQPDAGERRTAGDLAGFAISIYPAAPLTPEYWGWQLRRSAGPRALPLMRTVGRRLFRL